MKQFIGIKSAPIFISLLIVLLHLVFHGVRILGMNTSIFYMDEQITLAAFFTFTLSILIFFVAVLNYKDKLNLFNSLYLLFFPVLALDEYFEIHEKVREIVANQFIFNNFIDELFSASWIFVLIIPIIMILSALIYNSYKEVNKFSKNLKFAGIISFGLVLLFEFIGGQSYGDPSYLIYTAIEEGLEMLGLSFFFYSEYIKLSKKIKFSDSK